MISFYPGCTLSSSAKPYSRSLYWTCKRLGIAVTELPDWSCCGATSAHALSKDLAYALPARNLAIAQGLQSDLMVACSACYSRLKITQRALEDSAIRDRVQRIVGMIRESPLQIKNVLEILNEETHLQRLRQERTKALEGLKVACYYGCLVTRMPRVLGFDNVENPMVMEQLASTAGANVVNWPYKTACCGASFSVINETISLKMCAQILEMAKRCGADILVTSCPFCQYNLDWAQWKLQREDGREPAVPIVFITQLLGLALGGSEKELMLGANLAGAGKIVCPVGARRAVPLHQSHD